MKDLYNFRKSSYDKICLCILMAFFCLFAGCKNSETGDSEDLSSDKAITSFSINGSDGVINGRYIKVALPGDTDPTCLIAVFTTTGVMVTEGVEIQQSGVTVNDFTEPLVYTVIAEDGTTSDYLVTVFLCQPAAPDGLSATDGSRFQRIILTWNSVTGADGYNVYGSDSSNGAYTQLNMSMITGLTYTESGLSDGQHRFYRVSSVKNSCAESLQSEYDEGFASLSLVVAPPEIIAGKGLSGKITVSWNEVPEAQYYRVFRSNEPGVNSINDPYVEISGDVTGLTYDDSDAGLVQGREYYYKVKAYADGMESNYSNYDVGFTGELNLTLEQIKEKFKTIMQNVWAKIDEDGYASILPVTIYGGIEGMIEITTVYDNNKMQYIKTVNFCYFENDICAFTGILYIKINASTLKGTEATVSGSEIEVFLNGNLYPADYTIAINVALAPLNAAPVENEGVVIITQGDGTGSQTFAWLPVSTTDIEITASPNADLLQQSFYSMIGVQWLDASSTVPYKYRLYRSVSPDSGYELVMDTGNMIYSYSDKYVNVLGNAITFHFTLSDGFIPNLIVATDTADDGTIKDMYTYYDTGSSLSPALKYYYYKVSKYIEGVADSESDLDSAVCARGELAASPTSTAAQCAEAARLIALPVWNLIAENGYRFPLAIPGSDGEGFIYATMALNPNNNPALIYRVSLYFFNYKTVVVTGSGSAQENRIEYLNNPIDAVTKKILPLEVNIDASMYGNETGTIEAVGATRGVAKLYLSIGPRGNGHACEKGGSYVIQPDGGPAETVQWEMPVLLSTPELTAQDMLCDGIQLSWTSSSCMKYCTSSDTEVIKYALYRSDNGGYGTYTRIASDLETVTYIDRTCSSTNSTATVPYCYKVMAYHSYARSDYSMFKMSHMTCYDIIPPATVQATDGTYIDRVVITWTDNNNYNYYDVYRSDSASGSFAALITGVTSTTYTDYTGTLGKTYYYKVRAGSFINGGYKYSTFSDADSGYRAAPSISQFFAAYKTALNNSLARIYINHSTPSLWDYDEYFYDSTNTGSDTGTANMMYNFTEANWFGWYFKYLVHFHTYHESELILNSTSDLSAQVNASSFNGTLTGAVNAGVNSGAYTATCTHDLTLTANRITGGTISVSFTVGSATTTQTFAMP